ncbi:MAG: hypothetical protein UY67_C0037G0004 [Candidatus Kaiserbacteria bacterium GW2011_GWA2_52_12]|uniref:Uncharacterized protein n=1 Tax=Candidatus Kaiserbacteria bacterium GW2011_GWA2_52_12 TaxID=1618671 RepID=A0A0G1Z5G6_9BACT|nr:MAG: hypothetical protein UY67_C0037G0004 [Candidatus Kaiserbacteria bacterium GW2011_GWA2_52_12]
MAGIPLTTFSREKVVRGILLAWTNCLKKYQ